MDNQKSDIDKIKEVIDMLRPYINGDGGDLEFVKFEDKYVYIKLKGACSHCDFADVTIKDGIFESIKSEVRAVHHEVRRAPQRAAGRCHRQR